MRLPLCNPIFFYSFLASCDAFFLSFLAVFFLEMFLCFFQASVQSRSCSQQRGLHSLCNQLCGKTAQPDVQLAVSLKLAMKAALHLPDCLSASGGRWGLRLLSFFAMRISSFSSPNAVISFASSRVNCVDSCAISSVFSCAVRLVSSCSAKATQPCCACRWHL